MTSYFWSGFPSLSGRSDVMYGRRHIGGTDPPALRVTPIGSDSYAIVPPIAYCPTSPRFSSLLFGLSLKARDHRVDLGDLTRSRVNELVRSTRIRDWSSRSSSLVMEKSSRRSVPRARTKSRLVFDLMAIRNYASTPGTARGVRMHRKLARPSGPARVHFNY